MKNYQSKSSLNHQTGMALIELMIATVILAIITSVAMPSMRDMFTRKSVQSITTIFERSIKLARVEATQRSINITVKPTSNTNDWAQGWRIEYTDTDGNLQIIKQFDALSNGAIFTSNTFNAGTDLVILPTGQAQTIGTFQLFYPQCTGNGLVNFTLLLSGIVRKGVAACP